MKLVLLSLTTLLFSMSAFAADTYCKDDGRADLIIAKDKIELTTKGVGEADGVINFVDVTSRGLNADEIEMYSEYLTIPLDSGTAYFANIVSGKNKAKAQVITMTTKKDLKGKTHKALMVSLGGSPPSLIGIDTECK
jgi:hypothetical protein